MPVTADDVLSWEPERQRVWLEANLPIHTSLRNLLYPQYANWLREIREDDWRWMRSQAHLLLAESERGIAPVRTHWEDVAAGMPPFGMRIRRNPR